MRFLAEFSSSEQQPLSSGGYPAKSPKKDNKFSLGKVLAFGGIAILAGILVTSLVRLNNNSPVPDNKVQNEPTHTFTETPPVILTDTPLPTVTMVSEGTSIVSEDGFVEPTAEELANFAAETDALLDTMGEGETLPAKSGEILIFNPASEKSIKLRARFERFMDLAAHGYYPVFATRSFAMETIKDGSTGFDVNLPPIHPDNLKQVKNIVYIRVEYVNDKTKKVWGDDPKDVSQNLIGPTPFRNLVFGRNNNRWTISADWEKAKVIKNLPKGSSEVLKTYFVGTPEKIKLWPRVSVIWFIAADDTLSSFLDSNSDWYTPELLRAQGMLYPIALDY